MILDGYYWLNLKPLAMTKRDLFILLIRLFAVSSLVSSLLSSLPMAVSMMGMGDAGLDSWWIPVIVLLLLGATLLLIRNAGKVVDWLSLDKGFDEERIDLAGFDALSIVKLGCCIHDRRLLARTVPTLPDAQLSARDGNANSIRDPERDTRASIARSTHMNHGDHPTATMQCVWRCA